MLQDRSPQLDEYDLFVSYARADNADGWVERFVEALVEEHRKFSGGRELTYFIDKQKIGNFSYWETEIFSKGIVRSRLFLAFLSPNYFASDICRKESRAWIDREIALHILSDGAAPIYFVEIPGLYSKPIFTEQQVAQEVARLCGREPIDRFTGDVVPVVREFRRRQLVSLIVDNVVQPFYGAGVTDLRKQDLREVLQELARDLDQRSKDAKGAADSENEVPAYNSKFTGRLDELVELRRRLTDKHTGVIAGIHGLGGIGKTELAYTYAHAFASVYPGGRFLLRCEHETSLSLAVLQLGQYAAFHPHIGDEERKRPDDHFHAVVRCLKERITRLGHVLLVLDNVAQLDLLSTEQTDELTKLGPKLHLLATTRLVPRSEQGWLTLGELAFDDALLLLERYRPFADETERDAATQIVKKLGGFALAIELVAAGLAVNSTATYAGLAGRIGLDDLDTLAEDHEFELRRHNHQRRLEAVLRPTLVSLTPEQRLAIEYAALLPPDMVPLPWLKALVTTAFPDLDTPDRIKGDRWEHLVDRLVRLGLFTRIEQSATNRRLVRIHRLVQELVRRAMLESDREVSEQRIKELVRQRNSALEQTANWQDAQWELEPLDALAWLLDGARDSFTSWLMNEVGLHWLHIAEWSKAEALMRRVLAIGEQSYGAEHSNVACGLNNLALLLQATNRLAEAEPLMRHALAIDEQSFGAEHPSVAIKLNNLASLLQATNRLAEAEPLMRRALAIEEQSFGAEHPSVARNLNNLAHLLQATNRLAEAEPMMRRALAIDEQSYGAEHPNVAIRLNNLAQLFQDTNRLAEAEPLMRCALAIDEQSFGAEHPNVAINLNNLALLLQATNRLAEAEPLMRRALAIEEQSFGPEHPSVARGLNNLAHLLQATNRLAEAEPLKRRALAIDEQSFGAEHPSVAISLNNLAQLLQATNRLAEAEPLMRRALPINEQSFGAEHPNVAINLNNLALLLQATNRLPEADPLMRRALAIEEQSFGPEHPSVARGLNNLAHLLQATNRLAEAEPLMRRALAIDEQSFGAEHPNVARGLNNLALLLQATNRLAEAEPLMRRALAIDERSFGAEHPSVAISLNNLAQLLQATNRLAEAEPLMRRALAINEQSFGAEHPNVAINLNNLALLLQATNRLAEAEPLMRRALAIEEQSFGPEHPSVARGLNNLAHLLQATNRLAEAEPLMRRALAIDEQSFGAEHPNVAINLNNLALLLQAKNRRAEAATLLRRAVEILDRFQKATGHEHRETAKFRKNLRWLQTERMAAAGCDWLGLLFIAESIWFFWSGWIFASFLLIAGGIWIFWRTRR